jgi:hypothetical protein
MPGWTVLEILARLCKQGVEREAGSGLDVCWPDFGLTVTPSADNCCALLSNVLTGQRLTCWPQERPYISTDQKVRPIMPPPSMRGDE